MKKGDLGYNYCTKVECDFVQYSNPTPVVAAVVEYEKEQVIIAHNTMWPAGWFGLITGFLEKHEHPAEAVIREVKEELDLDATLESFIGHYTFNKMNQVIMAYHLKAEGPIVLSEELDDYKIIPFGKVSYWPAGTGYALRDHLLSRGFNPKERPFPAR